MPTGIPTGMNTWREEETEVITASTLVKETNTDTVTINRSNLVQGQHKVTVNIATFLELRIVKLPKQMSERKYI